MWESRSKIIWKGTESFDIVSKWERRRLCWEYLGGKGGWNLLKNRESFVPSVCVRSVTQSYLTLSQPHGLQPTRLLCPGDYPGKNKWVAISYSRGSTWPRDWTWVSCVSCIGRRTLPVWHLESPWFPEGNTNRFTERACLANCDRWPPTMPSHSPCLLIFMVLIVDWMVTYFQCQELAKVMGRHSWDEAVKSCDFYLAGTFSPHLLTLMKSAYNYWVNLEADPDPDEPGGNSTPRRDVVDSLVRDLGRSTRSAMPRYTKMIKIISGYSTKLIKCGIISYIKGKQFTN